MKRKIKYLICSILSFLAILSPFYVSALSFSSSSVGYGYTQTYNGNTSTRTFTQFSSSNLSKYNYDLPNSSYIDIDEFDFRFTITGNFQKDTNYITTFNWYSYNSQNDVFYNYFSHLVSDVKCRVTNWNSTNESESACFTNWNVSGQNINNDYVKVTFTFTPKKSFYGLTLYFKMPEPYNSYPSDGWEITDLEYRIVTSDSQDIINNANQNANNIINNQNNNTSSIINNQNQNTQNIINNQNSNTQAIIDSNKTCNYIDKNNIVLKDKYLLTDGVVTNSGSNFGITSYIKINSSSSTIKVINPFTTSSDSSLCFYDINKELISCFRNSSYAANDFVVIPNNSSYVRFTIRETTNIPTFEICTNGSQALTDSLTDSDIGNTTNDLGDFITGFQDNDTTGLSGIVSAPLRVFNTFINAQCTGFELPIYQDYKLQVPCLQASLSAETKNSTYFQLLQTLLTGLVSYACVVSLYRMVKDLKNPDDDRVEVIDL